MMNSNYLKHYLRKDSKSNDLNPVDTPITREKTRKTLTWIQWKLTELLFALNELTGFAAQMDT